MTRTYHLVCLLLVVLASTGIAQAQNSSRKSRQAYPSKPIRIVVTSAPSTGPDIVSRLIGQKLTEAWGQQVVVDDRAGASGNIGAENAARAAPDGYTLMMATSQHAIGAALFEKLNYDLVKDFSPVSLLATTPFILVVSMSVPATSVQELVALGKSRPGELSYGSSGTGGMPYLAAEMFKTMTGTDLLHVPYKGASAPITDTISGQVQLTFSAVPAVLSALKAGKVRALGVTSLKRTSLVPNLPTIAESVPGYEMIGWYGLVARSGTSSAILTKLNAEVVKALKIPEFQERLSSMGAEPMGTTPREFAAFIEAQIAKMRKAVKAAGARPDMT
jgi:tripartite-type tricarboxylate transporter receptor subunit TctC